MDPLKLIFMLAVLGWTVYCLARIGTAFWTVCRYGPEDIDPNDIPPPNWGLDAGGRYVCRHCGARIVLSRARLRQLDLE